jgi:hypothetical protein
MCAASEETKIAAGPCAASGSITCSIRAAPIRLTRISVSQSPMLGDSAATCASVRSGPCPDTKPARSATDCVSVMSQATTTTSCPSARSIASRSAIFSALLLASTSGCRWLSRRAVAIPMPPAPMTTATGQSWHLPN